MQSSPQIAMPESTSAAEQPGRRWRISLMVLFVAGMFLAWGVQHMARSSLASKNLPAGSSADRFDATVARPELSPEQVVARQVASMRAALTDHDRLLECYSLAAPSNRASTGPFERFSDLVRSPPYDQLGLSQEYQIGKAVVDDDVAAVLVSLITTDNRSSAFRFVLRKQSQAPHVDCWMTEGVFVLTAEDQATPTNSVIPDAELNSHAPANPFPEATIVPASPAESVEPAREKRFD